MRKLQQKSLKLAKVGLRGLRKEAISIEVQDEAVSMMLKLQKVVQKILLRQVMGVSTLNNRFSI